MSPEAPKAAVTSRQWLCAGSDSKGPSCHLVLPTTQDQQSLAVVARGVLLQEGELCQRTSPGQAWLKVLGTGKAQLHVLDTLQASLQQWKMPTHPLYSQTSQLWGCWGQVPPAQVMLSPCAAHDSGPLRAQPDRVMCQEGMSLSPHLNHVVQ